MNSDRDQASGCSKQPILTDDSGEGGAAERVESKMSQSLAERYFKITAVVALYWFVSISMVFLNKSLLSGQSSVDAPFFVTWYQCLFTVAALFCLAGVKKLLPRLMEAYPSLHVCPRVMVKVLPLSLVFVAMITFNNLCLKYVGVSFYYIGRSLTTVFNVLLTFLLIGEKTSLRAMACCLLIIAGFWLGVDQEGESGSLSVAGTVYGVLASLFVSLYAIYIKKALVEVGDNVWLMTLYNNVNAGLLFLPLMLLSGEFYTLWNFDQLTSVTFWTVMSISGLFGFAISYVTGLQVMVTSPLTHNISGTAKAAAQTLMATQWNAEVKTWLWWLSNLVVLLGSAAYARVRQLEMASRTKSGQTRQPDSVKS